MTALSSLIVRPAIQQTSPNSPQPFISFILPDSPTLSHPVVPILVAVVLPAEISEDYSLSDLFVFAENDFVTTFPLTEEPLFDEKSNSLIWLFAGSYEASLDQSPTQSLNLIPLTLSAYALFEPFEPSSSPLSAYDEFSILIDLKSLGGEEEGKGSVQAGESVSEKPDTPSTSEAEEGQASENSRTSQSKEALAKKATKRAVAKDPKLARKVFEQEVVAKALSKAKKNPKSTAKGNGIVITVGAYPDVLPADGKSTAFIVAKVTDEKGSPLSGREVSFISTGGQILVREAKTNEQGIAFSRLLSETLGKGEKKVVRVRAKTNPEAETEVLLIGGETLTVSSSSVTSYAFVYWKKYTPNGEWYCTPKPEYCSHEEEDGASGLSGIALHVITPLGYWTAYPNFVEVIGDGHPNQYRYTETSFQFDQNTPCPPPPNPNNPNQQRFHFSWQPMEGVRWAELHRSGITVKVNYTVGRYYPYPPQFWTEEKVFNLNAVNAVLVIDPSSPKVLAWDPENPNQSELTVKFKVDTLQVGRIWVWMRIYACSRANEEGPVKVIEKETTTNMDTSITWDGSTNEGGVADKGLYAYDLFVCVEQLSPKYVDRDRRVSEYLTIERAKDEEGNEIFEAEYYGYDDKGTEEVEDDDHLYFIRWYVLKDKEGRNASSGEVWLYDPDLQFVERWDVRELQCLEHKGERDGLEASVDGVKHGILVPVPVNLMQKAGTYYFVLHFEDNHADKYKDHKVKPALEMNATVSTQVQFDLDIADGQFGAIVPDNLEEKEGAFTVANLNDTDSNGIEDVNQNPVPGEKDLMKLVVRFGNTGSGGTATLQAIKGGQLIKIWMKDDKSGGIISLPYTFQVPANQRIPYQVLGWIEGVQHSSQLCDVVLELEYQGKRDRVAATLIWADKTNFRNSGNSLSPDADGQEIRETFRTSYRSTLGLALWNNPWEVMNAMEMEFTVKPSGLKNLVMNGRITFDITRQKAFKTWVKSQNQPSWGQPIEEGYFPTVDEEPNNDESNTDEDNIPTNDHIYSIDGPGLLLWLIDQRILNAIEAVSRSNFYEFVRVRIANSNQWSRCSNKVKWCSRIRVIKDNQGNWQRLNRNPDDNLIQEGWINIGSP